MLLRKRLLVIGLLSAGLSGKAQVLIGNEWIRAGQPYLKVTVNQAGIHRIRYSDIKNGDASFLKTNPAGWQLFFRGQEIAIRMSGQQGGTFTEQSSIEFYGEGNDGSQDSLLYRPQSRLHPYQTLFSDQSAYFLTASPTSVGKRMAVVSGSGEGLIPETFHVQESVQAFTSDYTFNNLKGIEPFLQQSYFEPGEGWSGKLISTDSIGAVDFSLPGRVNVDWPIRLEGLINGRDNQLHQIQIQVNDSVPTSLASLRFLGFTSQPFQATLPPGLLRDEKIRLRFKPERNVGANQFSITYVNVSYPQQFDMNGEGSKVFHLPAGKRQTVLLAIQHIPSSTFAYDVTDKLNCRYLPVNSIASNAEVVVDGMGQNRDILVTNQVLNPLSVKPVQLRFAYPASTDYLIITHGSLKKSAMAYADYRASVSGGGHKPLVVDVDSLFDAFNYGERSPLAIRRFARFMLQTTVVKNMLLIGKANSYPYFIKTAADDLVPTIGYPGSDVLLTAGLGGTSANTPAIPTGRLAVTTNEQVLDYLTKVKHVEAGTPNGLWRKQLVHISGGKSEPEAKSLELAMRDLETVFVNGQLGGEVKSFSKSNPYSTVEPVNIAPVVNDGVSLITFFGHAGPAITDMNFGFASAPQNGFRNTIYPFMIFNGCGVGEIFSRFNTLSTDWVLAPDKGAALVLAHSYYSYEAPTTRYLKSLYRALFTNPATLGQSFGKVQQQVNAELEKEGANLYDVSVLLQMILQGDPALQLYPLARPDFSVAQKGVYIQASVVGSTLQNSDSIQVIVPLANLGRFQPNQSVALSIRTTGKTVGSHVVRMPAFRYLDTLVYTLPNDRSLQKIDVLLDPDSQVDELSRDNNAASLAIDWPQASVGSRYPSIVLPDVVSPALTVLVNGSVRENGAIVDTRPELTIYLTDERPLSVGDTDAVDVYISTCDTCSPAQIPRQRLLLSELSPNQLQIKTTLELAAGSTYQLTVFGKDAAGNRTQPPYALIMGVVSADEPITFTSYPNPTSTYVRFELNLPLLALPTEARLAIYSIHGIQVFDEPFPVLTGKNTLLWQTQVPGVYSYRLRLGWQDGRSDVRTGKVVWLH
ncbi:putative type IX secretion system sortase PorU2 [Spirosoma sordidisoli]|uniref:Gingipain domain-containing protein n=2 Tax=Spirosoma sordidisoli TaxID=2502893 RepID=A0A4Q2UPE4_9BACT|nr:hypothetical protein EQG79_04055 [Spirosoma sordidisoli]